MVFVAGMLTQRLLAVNPDITVLQARVSNQERDLDVTAQKARALQQLLIHQAGEIAALKDQLDKEGP
jgi:hypothetical protein